MRNKVLSGLSHCLVFLLLEPNLILNNYRAKGGNKPEQGSRSQLVINAEPEESMGNQRLRTEGRRQRAGATSDQEIIWSGGFSDQPEDRLRNGAALRGKGCSGLEGSNQGEAAMPPCLSPTLPSCCLSWDRFSPLTDFGVFFSTQDCTF